MIDTTLTHLMRMSRSSIFTEQRLLSWVQNASEDQLKQADLR
jgi:hypothetical protein